MLRRNDRDRLLGDVDPEADELFVDVRKMFADEFGLAVRYVEMDIVEAKPLDLMVDCAGDDIARRKLGALVETRHETLAGARNLELPALASDRLGNQEVLDLQIVEASGVELHELHVGDAAAGAPCHRNSVAGGSTWCG